MKILSIIIKELKHDFRDKHLISIMILFPLLLIVILGAAFSGGFDGESLDLNNTRVIYHSDEKGEFSKGFSEFIKRFNDMGMTFENIDDKENALELVKNDYYACYIEIDEPNKQIKLYKNNRYNFEAGLIEGVLGTFVQRYNVISEIAKTNTSALKKISLKGDTSFVKVESIDKKKSPRAIDYYGITMLTMTIMYSIMTGTEAIKMEERIKTENRMHVSPTRKYNVFIGKVLGVFLVSMFQMLIVMIFSKKVFNVYFGNDICTVLVILCSQIIMSICVGVGIGIMIKREEIANGFMNVIIPVMVFLGGGYVPIEQYNIKALNLISNISPVKWINKSIFSVVYGNDYRYVKTAIMVNVSIALVFFILSSLRFMRKEVA
ncbi:ABC-2 family transporter protein [Clostridium tepidiprofundi DSM 19306]|uniref:ABC-2 family transporter protein n=1 Tax=Clostridium tepidiprofundi DSM 19306 TaxID=1121338 RepID=A0A151ATA0_9CLOT|nr:SagG family ABC transporter permease subunit [Clostridium tepidiprofundi]KYH30835.1 ABC-2 family transporter protein [Clostridium tepidiprofundi DSM 19306]